MNMSLTKEDLSEIDRIISKRISENNVRLLEYFPTKAELSENIEASEKKLRNEFRMRTTDVQDAIYGFRKEIDCGIMPETKLQLANHAALLEDHGRRIAVLEDRRQRG